MALYALTRDPNVILRTADSTFIPTDPANADYLAYLDWVALGNTADPLPAVSAATTALLALEANDAVIFRALEVLIDVLLAKGVIVATDFSPAVRTLYQARKALRTTAGVP